MHESLNFVSKCTQAFINEYLPVQWLVISTQTYDETDQ